MAEVIKEFPNYLIFKDGGIYSMLTGKFIRPKLNETYPVVRLMKEGKIHYKKIHRLLCEAYLPNPYNYPVIDHIDRNKHNNDLSNLRWTTVSKNNRNKKCKGYWFENGKYRVAYSLNGKLKHVGAFETPEQAKIAYLEAIQPLL
jgi:hypothetical protein